MNGKYSVFVTPAAERSCRKLPQKVIRFVQDELPRTLQYNPHAGTPLAPPLQPLRSFHFSRDGQPYRAAYSVQEKETSIIIHFVGHRRDFYERLTRLLR